MNQNEHVFPQARTTEIVTKDMPDEVLVYDLKTHKAHCLNQTAAAVWKYCDGKKTIMDITSLLQKDFNTPVDEVTIWFAVDRLSKANLLEERLIIPIGMPRLSRREVVRKLGMGAAMALPVVMSIVAPSAASAATCGDSNNNNNSNPADCPCNQANDCISVCCNGSPNTCHPGDLGTNSSCTTACECQSNCCVSNTCHVGNLAAGQPCTTGCECQSNSCPTSPTPRRCA